MYLFVSVYIFHMKRFQIAITMPQFNLIRYGTATTICTIQISSRFFSHKSTELVNQFWNFFLWSEMEFSGLQVYIVLKTCVAGKHVIDLILNTSSTHLYLCNFSCGIPEFSFGNLDISSLQPHILWYFIYDFFGLQVLKSRYLHY